MNKIILLSLLVANANAEVVNERPSFIRPHEQRLIANEVIEARECINYFLKDINAKTEIDQIKLVNIVVNMSKVDCNRVVVEYFKESK